MKRYAITFLTGIIILLMATSAFCASRLHQAASKGNVMLAKQLLRTKPDPDIRDMKGGTALHAAMFQSGKEIIRLLIKNDFDINAKNTITGNTPLHDAAGEGNLDAVIILIEAGARTDILSNSGDTVYQVALKEEQTEITQYLDRLIQKNTGYDHDAKMFYSENDVKSFVYKWFAALDHQADMSVFTSHLDPKQVDMHFPDFPVKSMDDFSRWYTGVTKTIQWNSYKVKKIAVSGSEQKGFSVGIDTGWQARTYDGIKYDLEMHEDWELTTDKHRTFIITKQRSRITNK